MFVFDSTGSMGPVLEATRRRMTRMLEALQALVPDARVGVVTYRDRGQTEEYLTRAVPLDRDLYRALNFMQTVEAGGGGDRPEAVYDALMVAIEQEWSRDARRVIVLIGDAPAHRENERKIQRALKRFTRDGQSHVHAIMTSPDVLGGIDPRTRESFSEIADDGEGVCLPFENEESILRQVLTLSIGRDFRDEIDEVFRILESRETTLPRGAELAIRRADRMRIERILARTAIPAGFLDALVATQSREIADILIDILLDARIPERGLQAAAFALQRMLGLRTPPVDVEGVAQLDEEDAERLRKIAQRRLRDG